MSLPVTNVTTHDVGEGRGSRWLKRTVLYTVLYGGLADTVRFPRLNYENGMTVERWMWSCLSTQSRCLEAVRCSDWRFSSLAKREETGIVEPRKYKEAETQGNGHPRMRIQ